MPSKYQIQKLKDFEKANEYLSIALSLLNDQNYILNLKHFKQLVAIKLKLENLIKDTKSGYTWAKRSNKNE